MKPGLSVIRWAFAGVLVALFAAPAFAQTSQPDYPIGPGWMQIVPGKNPLTAEQAAAWLVFSAMQSDAGCPIVDLDKLAIDVEAGGNQLRDFVGSGKHVDLTVAEKEKLGHSGADGFAIASCMNPYAKE